MHAHRVVKNLSGKPITKLHPLFCEMINQPIIPRGLSHINATTEVAISSVLLDHQVPRPLQGKSYAH